MEHTYGLLLLGAECRACSLLKEVLLKSRNTHCHLLLHAPTISHFFGFFFTLLISGALLQFYFSHLAVAVVLTFPLALQVLVNSFICFVTQGQYSNWYKPFQCNPIFSHFLPCILLT